MPRARFLAHLRRATNFYIRDPGAAQPDGRLHLATFLARLWREPWIDVEESRSMEGAGGA